MLSAFFDLQWGTAFDVVIICPQGGIEKEKQKEKKKQTWAWGVVLGQAAQCLANPGGCLFFCGSLSSQLSHSVTKATSTSQKAESKPLWDDHKRCNREPEFSTIQLNQQPLSWVRSRGQKRERVWKGKDLREGANERRSRSESRLNSQIKEEWVSQRCIHSSKVTNHPQLLLRA